MGNLTKEKTNINKAKVEHYTGDKIRKLTNPSVVNEILNKYNVSLDKAYGQHFLIDDNIRQKIINEAELRKEDVVLEVGPGIGTLSQEIAPAVKRLYLVELDKHFVPILEENLRDFENVEILQADALRISYQDFDQIPTKMVSNLPYNIAAPLIIKLLKECPYISEYVLMVQREMADRLIAKIDKKDYGALTVKVSYLAEVDVLFNVSEQVFMPKPKVSSAVVRIRRQKNKEVNEQLFELTEKVFRYRRKTIKKALLHAGYKRKDIKEALRKAGIDSIRRPQNLDLRCFQLLSAELANH